jgi:hypothetical protein
VAGGRRARLTVLCLLGALALFVLPSGAWAANGPFEPNDSLLGAAGPLTLGQTYTAGLETASDADFYFFYVTSPDKAAVMLSAANLGGGAAASVIDATIADASATPLGAISYLAQGTERSVSLNLAPQKYFVEVTTNQAFNTSAGGTYRLSTSGGAGAFGPYAPIAARCARGTKGLAKAQKGLRRARGKLQRTTARLRLARYGTRRERRAARRAQRRARRRVRSKRRALTAAKRAQRPWCSIPQ